MIQSSRLQFFEKFLAKMYLLSDAQDNTYKSLSSVLTRR